MFQIKTELFLQSGPNDVIAFFRFFGCAISMSGQQTKWPCSLLREKGKNVEMWREGERRGRERREREEKPERKKIKEI